MSSRLCYLVTAPLVTAARYCRTSLLLLSSPTSYSLVTACYCRTSLLLLSSPPSPQLSHLLFISNILSCPWQTFPQTLWCHPIIAPCICCSERAVAVSDAYSYDDDSNNDLEVEDDDANVKPTTPLVLPKKLYPKSLKRGHIPVGEQGKP